MIMSTMSFLIKKYRSIRVPGPLCVLSFSGFALRVYS